MLLKTLDVLVHESMYEGIHKILKYVIENR